VNKNIITHAMAFFCDEIFILMNVFQNNKKKLVLRLFFHFLKKKKFTKSKPRSLVVAIIFKIFYNPSKFVTIKCLVLLGILANEATLTT
jgi:hypothetical protein